MPNLDLQRVIQAAKRRYRGHYGVRGVSIGIKFIGLQPSANHAAVQFFVKEKRPAPSLGRRRLPRFVFGRDEHGNLIREIRLATDVIAVGRIRPACGAGDILRSLNDKGVISLLFHNTAHGDVGQPYIVSCAHVVGDLKSSPPIPSDVHSDCIAIPKLASTIFASVPRAGRMDFDIALAKIEPGIPKQPNCTVVTTHPARVLKSALSKDHFKPPIDVECALPASLITRATVSSSEPGVVLVDYHSIGECEVANAHLVKAGVIKGDSGGLLFKGDAAIGIVFARSDEGWGWFHLLSDALDYINRSINTRIEPFPEEEIA